MTNRIYRLIFGALMLLALYLDFKYLVYFLIGMMIFEGITNWRIPLMISKLRGIASEAYMNADSGGRFNVEAERIWRLMIGIVFLVSFVILPEQLWIVPWFLAFVIFGAGASDVCPGLSAMKKVGCR